MRSYLVVMDETTEARVALRWTARRAARTGLGIVILAMIPPQEFVQWGGVQAAIEEEARLRAEAMVLQASGAVMEEAGIRPSILVREGDPVKVIGELLKEKEKEESEFAALVLGAAAEGGPGPLVSHFAGAVAGSLPCPLVIVPGSLPDEALDSTSTAA
jgi:nucleotide-binding universal stress UspA family protein